MQKKPHTAEPSVTELSPFEFEIDTSMFQKYKSPGSDQIPEELIQAGGEILLSEIHKISNSIWNKEELPDQCRNLLLYQFTGRAMKKL
jgi:hypothetical protein